MVLLRKNYKSDRISKMWNAAKRFGSFLLVAGFLMGNKGSCLGEEEKPPEPVPHEEVADAPIDITGKYVCKVTSSKGKGKMAKQIGVGAPYYLNIRDIGNTHNITKTNDFIPLTFKSNDLSVKNGKLTYTATATMGLLGCTLIFSLDVKGTISDTGTLEYKEAINLKTNKGCFRKIKEEVEQEAVCTPLEPKPVCDNYRRAVFIRPCAGQLFNLDFTGTLVGGGTVQSVCKDLKDSCVTDLFIPFKAVETPEEGDTGCGLNGELSYPSEKYPDHVNERFRKMHEKDGDPIKELIDTCSGMGIQVHASFAVFKDPKAIEIAGGAEKAGQRSSFLWVFRVHKSSIFADPENPTVVGYELDLLREIMSLYKLNEINLDFIRYAGSEEGDVPGFPDGVNLKPEAIEAFVRRVREEFPSVTLTADVFAGNGTRIRLGQNGIIPYLKYSILMQYSDTDPNELNTKDEVKKYTDEFKATHPGREFLSLLRGWRCHERTKEHPDGCNITEQAGDKNTPDEFKVNLKADIGSAKRSGANGYGVFTYENLLADVPEKKLKDLKDDIGY